MGTMTATVIGVLLCTVSVAFVALSDQQRLLRSPAVPLDAVTAIIDAYRSHTLVALGEGPHGNEQGHAFRLSLIRDPRFSSVVSDIVVECGNGRYQDIVDRFIRGEPVTEEALRDVLLNSSYETAACDRPIYGDFFRAVRAVNQMAPADHQLRILLGAPPVNWEMVHTRADLLKQSGGRDRFVFDLIRRDVIAQGHRALIVYGDGHFQARRERPARSLLALLDNAGIRTFAISHAFADFASIQPDVASWPIPSITLIRGTPIGEKSFSFFYGALPPGVKWPLQLEDHFDAILYLGPPSSMTMSRLSPELCRDPAYLAERTRRLAFMPSGRGQDLIKSLKSYCAAQQN